MKKIIYSIVLLFAVGILSNSCKKEFLETYPTDAVSADAAVLTTDNAWAALNGIHRSLYVRYSYQGCGGLGSYYIVNDCQGHDHVVNASQWYRQVYQWDAPRNATHYYNTFPWRMFYKFIGNANILINGIENAAGDQADKDAIKGQALLYRAFSHYQLVQSYADRYVPGGANGQLGIPYMLESSTEGKARDSVADVYTLINADIDEAITLLTGYVRKNKSHLNIDIARGLKARVALTQGNYAVASSFANQARTAAMGSYSLMDAATYALGFRIDSQGEGEYMWASQIQEDQTDKWANYGAYISRNFSSSAIRGNPRSISDRLYNLIPATDVRSQLYDPTGLHLNLPPGIVLLGSHSRHPYTNQKFIAVSTSDSRVDVPHMRISEMYLIEAEAEAQLGNSAVAAQLLYDQVITRDPAYVLSVSTGQTLVDEILLQRRIELWGEGFGWYDLKRNNLPLDRTGTNHDAALANNVLSVPAGDVMWTWLIPQDEIDANPLMEQNPLN